MTSGSNVVYAIDHVATDVNDKPLTNVVIQQVRIRRVGTAAQGFNFNAQGLPVVSNLFLKIASTGSQATLTFTNHQFADNRLYSSTDLPGSWTSEALGIEITTPVTYTIQREEDGLRRFYSVAQIQYASSTFAPKTLYGRTLTLNFTVGPGLITIVLDSSGGGTYTRTGQPSGTVVSYKWTQAPYRGSLRPLQLSGVVPLYPVAEFYQQHRWRDQWQSLF